MRNVVLTAAAFTLASCSSVKPCEDKVGAFVMAQEFIKKALKAPATAEFPMITADGVSSIPTTTADGRCAFSVITYVDAENSFGAKLRSKFAVTVAPNPEKAGDWSLIEFTDLSEPTQTPVQ